MLHIRTSLRVAALLAALLAAPASASTIWQVNAGSACPGSGSVGAPFCTIQAALVAASPGDEIVVAPGVYNERIDFLGKDVVLRSSAGPATTIVDGGQLGSVVTFANGEGPDALIRGFTLRNGGDPFLLTPGGGIYCNDSSPTISGNIIELNFAETGGGLALLGGSPVVTSNTVRDNIASFGAGIHCGEDTTAELVGNTISSNGQFGTTGGGIDVNSAAPLIHDNLIQGNSAAGGGGICVGSSLPVVVRGNVINGNFADEGDAGGLLTGPNTLVEDNQITGNSAEGEGAGVFAYGGTFRNNRIAGNTGPGLWSVVAVQGSSFEGDVIADNLNVFAGMRISGGPSGPPITLTRVTVSGHTSFGAISVLAGQALLEDCLITGNGSGLFAFNSGTQVTLRRCTLSNNTAFAVETADGAHAALVSCIAWGNGPVPGPELKPNTGTLDATWSIVRLGYPGTGNLALDPLFVDAPAGNFSLAAGSPAIDSGDPTDGVCAFDLAASPRRLDGQLNVGSEVDRGALEFDNARLTTSVPAPHVLRIHLSGTPGLPAWLFAALAPGQLCVEKWGRFGLDLSGVWVVNPWSSAPSNISVHIAPALSGLPIVLQALVGPPGFATGNLSNAVAVTLP